MTEKGGAAWRQTIYGPFCQASAYGCGEVLSADVRSFGSEFRPVKSVLCCDDLKRENSAEEEPVVPRPDSAVSFVQGKMQTVLKAASWNVVRLK